MMERIPRKVFLAHIYGHRPSGRPRKEWRRCREGEGMRYWMTLAQDRRIWNNLSRAIIGQQVAQGQ